MTHPTKDQDLKPGPDKYRFCEHGTQIGDVCPRCNPQRSLVPIKEKCCICKDDPKFRPFCSRCGGTGEHTVTPSSVPKQQYVCDLVYHPMANGNADCQKCGWLVSSHRMGETQTGPFKYAAAQPTSNQCGVKGCKNTRDSGAFVGPFCAPCDHDLRTGNFQFGTSVVYIQAREIERLRAALEKIAGCASESMRLALIAKEALSESYAHETTVPLSTYESAVKGRQDFRSALVAERSKVSALRTALEHAVEWGGPMAEAPRDSRPAWFDIARAALAASSSEETSADRDSITIPRELAESLAWEHRDGGKLTIAINELRVLLRPTEKTSDRVMPAGWASLTPDQLAGAPDCGAAKGPERQWRGIVAHDPRECGPCEVELNGIEERAAEKATELRKTRYCDYDLCPATFDPAHSNNDH